jgi:hypothetical protein
MRNNDRVSRKKVVWGFSIVLKHLKWYIETSEVIPNNEKGPLLDSLTKVHRQLVKADRIEDRYRKEEKGEFAELAERVIERRVAKGWKPMTERRLVDELIGVILQK